jgi:hemin uptake protein HemP
MKPSSLVANLPHPAMAAKPPFGPLRAAPVALCDEPTQVVASSELLRGRKSVQIEHNGALYQLRATKFGKLILTK